MPKYYGCPCEGCGKPLALTDDIVVCPDCGSPYHRACYERLGNCMHKAEHKAGFEWEFPYKDSELRTCSACGERTLRSEPVCRCCGAALPPEDTSKPGAGYSAADPREERFDYASFYAQNQRQAASAAERVRQIYKTAFGSDELMDGIPCSDWLAYIGPSGEAYMAAYSRMQLQSSKISMSFSALFFGPFYFFYRKAWKPAFAFLAAEILLSIPSLISMMQISGSALTPAISNSALDVLARTASVLSFVLMALRGLYGKWLYRKSSAERIRHIRDEFPDADQRRAVLEAQGGVSWAAVFGAGVLLAVICSAAVLLLGPDINALLSV